MIVFPRSRVRALVVLASVSAAAPSAAQGGPADSIIRVETGVQRDTVTVGDRFVALVRVTAPPGATVEFDALETGDTLEMIDRVRIIVGDSTVAAAYPLTAWYPDLTPSAVVGVRVSGAGAAPRELRVALRLPFVRPVLPARADVQPRPGRGVLPLAAARPWWWIVGLAAVTLAALALAARVLLSARRGADAGEDPREAALRALAEVSDASDPALRVEAAARVLRRYLSNLHTGWGEEWTTAELLLRARRALPPAVHVELERILTSADRAKFSGTTTAAGEASALVAAIEHWIRAYPEAPLELNVGREAA